MRKASYWCLGLTVALSAVTTGAMSAAQGPSDRAIAAFAQDNGNGNAYGKIRCGTKDLDEATARAADDYARAMFAQMGGSRAAGAAPIPVYWHVINNGTGIANGDIPGSQINDQINGAQRRVREHRLQFRAGRCGSDDERVVVHRDQRHDRGAEHEECAPAGQCRRPEHLLQQHGRRTARLGDIPFELRRAARRWTAWSSSSARCRAARRCRTTRAIRQPTRSGTGSGSTTPSRAAAATRVTW